jgi:hypothetical protein
MAVTTLAALVLFRGEGRGQPVDLAALATAGAGS